jgi:SOUL heme-binding protein
VSYETPTFRVVDRFGELEIRAYEPYVVAETTVDGDLESASHEGFRILARYIFRGNRGRRKLAMTTPVSQERVEGSRLATTAPATEEAVGGEHVIRFMMPTAYSRETLPEPNNPRVVIRELPARSLATLRYSGTWSKRNYQKHLERLVATLREQGYEPLGEPIWARYNPPFTPWFLRRNEILTEFRTAGGER